MGLSFGLNTCIICGKLPGVQSASIKVSYCCYGIMCERDRGRKVKIGKEGRKGGAGSGDWEEEGKGEEN